MCQVFCLGGCYWQEPTQEEGNISDSIQTQVTEPEAPKVGTTCR